MENENENQEFEHAKQVQQDRITAEVDALVPYMAEYDAFLSKHPDADAADLVDFLKEHGELAFGGVSVHWESQPPYAQMLASNAAERFLLKEYTTREFDAMQEQIFKEVDRAQGLDVEGLNEGDIARSGWDKIKANFLAQYVEKVIGIKRSAALLEKCMDLKKELVDMASGYEEPFSRQTEEVSPTLSENVKEWRQHDAFMESFEARKDAVDREITRRAEELSESDAREIFAKAFGVDFETYMQIYPEKPKN
ncbi:MAG: hypothetical protein Q8Q39_03065 [bacterium]|nr:hypothetical protein [bacterium]